MTANKNTSFDIRNNQIDGSCNLAPAQGGRETTDHWSEHIGQLFFAGSVEGSLISPTQFAKFLAIQRNNTFGTTEQKEMNFIYVPEAEGRPASEVGIVSFKPQ